MFANSEVLNKVVNKTREVADSIADESGDHREAMVGISNLMAEVSIANSNDGEKELAKAHAMFALLVAQVVAMMDRKLK